MNGWTILASVLFFLGALWSVSGAIALYQGTMQGGIGSLLILLPMIVLAWSGGYICLRRSRAVSAPIRRSAARPVSTTPLPPPPPPPPPTSPAIESVEQKSTLIAEAQAIPEASMSEWERRYRFLSSQKSASGCRFKDSSGNCVSPSPDYPIVRCTASAGASAAASSASGTYQPCFVYSILMQKLPLWDNEFRNRLRVETEMAGPIGECRICGNARKLNQDRMCSICILAAKRADTVLDQMGKESFYCDNCNSEIVRGEAFVPVEPAELRCVNCWKRTYAKY